MPSPPFRLNPALKNARSRHDSRSLSSGTSLLASSQIARDINSDIVMELLRQHQPVSRADLARVSGLQRSTVSLIVDRLIAHGWVREGAITERPRGRRPTMLVLNDQRMTMAVDLRPRHATVAVVDLNGVILQRARVSLSSEPVPSLQAVAAAIAGLAAFYPGVSFEGVGMALPGRVDPLIFGPNLGWPVHDIKQTLQAAAGLPVEIENAANACLLAQIWFGRMQGVRDAVLVAVAEGIGASILANGQLVHGRNGLAGEFGHVSLDPDGPWCSCGRRGCWELYASSTAALRYHAQATGRADPVSAAELLALAQDGDSQAIAALGRQIDGLVRGLQMICTALAPERVLITGDIIGAWGQFSQRLASQLSGLVLSGAPPEILPSEEAETGRLRGAAVLMFRRRSQLAAGESADDTTDQAA